MLILAAATVCSGPFAISSTVSRATALCPALCWDFGFARPSAGSTNLGWPWCSTAVVEKYASTITDVCMCTLTSSHVRLKTQGSSAWWPSYCLRKPDAVLCSLVTVRSCSGCTAQAVASLLSQLYQTTSPLEARQGEGGRHWRHWFCLKACFRMFSSFFFWLVTNMTEEQRVLMRRFTTSSLMRRSLSTACFNVRGLRVHGLRGISWSPQTPLLWALRHFQT